LHQPELLFLDEPTSAVDPENRRAFWETLFDLVAEGTTILVSTHYMDEAERCHALAILDLGVLVASGSPAELSDGIEASVVVVEAHEPRKVSKFLDQQAFVHSTAQIGNTLRVMVDKELDDPAETTRNVLMQADLPIEGCAKVRPSLEDVFVAATQARKAVRDKK
jgi:ABC-2 type transport system ATP-binding protein